MQWSYYDAKINKRTRGRYDTTPLYADKAIFANLIADLAAILPKGKIDAIVGLDALGFIIGAALANQQGTGFIPIRKGGKLPGLRGTVRRISVTDYSGTVKKLEVSTPLLRRGMCVVLVDDWIETGAQMKAAIKLLEPSGVHVVGIVTLGAERKKTTEVLFTKYNLRAIQVF